MPNDDETVENKQRKDIKKLNQEFDDAKACDKDLRSEQRTNVQLVAGDHYNRYGSRYWNRLREAKQISPEVRLRITKNHIGKITKIYRNEIQRYCPGVTIMPKNEKEMQDQKAAELNNAVWQDLKERHALNKKIRTWIKNFVEIGEVAVKVFWDPDAGVQVGWQEPEVDPMTGQPLGEPEPIMAGDITYETIIGPDLFRDPEVKSMEDSKYLIIQKMASMEELKLKYESDPAKLKMIQEDSKETFRVFEAYSNNYKSKKDLILLREHYYKPCKKYPNGYYWHCTESGILEEGELPFGFFPIIYEGFDEITTSPRHYSIIKQLRSSQVEVNRIASKIAEHQVTLGDDKVILTANSKPSSGMDKPGIRWETISGIGQQPTVIPGRAGDQYLTHLQNQIEEMYKLADVSEELKEQDPQADPYAMLFSSLKQKKKFVIYSDKFENFLQNVCTTSLRLMKRYASEHLVVQAVGKNEVVNIQEFKASEDMRWQIVAEPQVDDIENKVGKQLVLNNIIQYIGPQLEKDDTGKFIRLSPYLNKEKMLEDMTVEYDNSVNDILALDRGEYPPPSKYEDHKYQLKRLTQRMKQADFRFKSPYIHAMYEQKVKEHEQAIAQEAMALQAAQAGFIPSGGYSVACDFYVPDPKNPQSSKRLRLPSEALDWLVKKLEQQGSVQEGIEKLPPAALAEIGQLLQPEAPMPGQASLPGV